MFDFVPQDSTLFGFLDDTIPEASWTLFLKLLEEAGTAATGVLGPQGTLGLTLKVLEFRIV